MAGCILCDKSCCTDCSFCYNFLIQFSLYIANHNYSCPKLIYIGRYRAYYENYYYCIQYRSTVLTVSNISTLQQKMYSHSIKSTECLCCVVNFKLFSHVAVQTHLLKVFKSKERTELWHKLTKPK